MAIVSHAPHPVVFERERGVYRVDVKHDLAHAVVKLGADHQRAGQILSVLRALASEQIPIFLIKMHRSAVTFAMEGGQVPDAKSCLQRAGFECSTRTGLALLVVVASSMRDLTGVMVDIADSLQQAGARLYGTGDSHNSVQCLIDGGHAERAVAQLNRTFGLEGGDG